MCTIEKKNKGNYSYLCLFMYFAFVVGVLHFADAEAEQAWGWFFCYFIWISCGLCNFLMLN